MSGTLPDPSSPGAGDRPITIRAGTPADAPAIRTLHRRSILAVGREFYTEAEVASWAHGLVPERYARAMSEKGEEFLLAIDEAGAVVGFCSYKDDEILGLYVDPSHARSGIGRAMLDRAERALASAGQYVIKVRASRSGHDFYETQGFQVVSERFWKTRGGVEIVVFEMEKAIAGPDGRPADARP